MSATRLSPTPEAWTPELTAGWTVGDRQGWEIVDNRNHPALGLHPAALTATVQEAGMLPDGWDDHLAGLYALAAHGFLSSEVGGRPGLRSAWSHRMRTLVSVVMTERVGLPATFAAFAEDFADFRADRRWGWGTGEGGMRRLYHRGLTTRRGFEHVDAGAGRPWSLSHQLNHAALDAAWRLARTAGAESDSFIPLLPCEVVGCFAPSRRKHVVRTAGGNERAVHVPALWEIVAIALVMGPRQFVARGERFLAQEAERAVDARRDHKHREPVLAGTTLATVRGNLNGTLDALSAVARSIPELRDQWAYTGRLAKLDKGVVRRGRATTRTAVPLTAFRRARAEHLRLLERSRVTSREKGAYHAAKEKKRYTTVLRRLLWLDLYAQTASRAGEIASTLRVSHFESSHRFELEGDAVITPAVLITPSKSVPLAPHWRPIHHSTAELLAEWIDWMELGPRDWLFPHGDRRTPWSAQQAGKAFSDQRVIPLPGGDHGYQLTRLRHLGEALAYTVGAAWLACNPAYADRVSAQVMADALLGHVMGQDRLGYKDLEEHRELWAYRAAMGDASQGIPGVIDMLHGDAGARKGWDFDRIRDALRRIDAADSRHAGAQAAVAAAERNLARGRARLDYLFERAPESSGLDGDSAPRACVAKTREWEIELRQAEHVREKAQDLRDDARERRTEAAMSLAEARAALADIERAGKTRCLADDEPLQSELPDGKTALDCETWQQVLVRAETLRGTAARVLAGEGTPPVRVRHHVNLQELAGVCDVTDRTVRNWFAGEQPSGPMAVKEPGAGGSPLVVITDRLRCVAVDRLPARFMAELSDSQQELTDQILMVPMGATRWGGPTIANDRIEAAERLTSPGHP